MNRANGNKKRIGLKSIFERQSVGLEAILNAGELERPSFPKLRAAPAVLAGTSQKIMELEIERHALKAELKAAQEAGSNKGVPIEISKIGVNPWKPLTKLDSKSLNESANNIREQVLMLPVVLRTLKDGSYQLVAGERIFRAHKTLGEATVMAVFFEASDDQMTCLALSSHSKQDAFRTVELAILSDCDISSIWLNIEYNK